MIYVTGDIHGNQFKWLEQIDPVLGRGYYYCMWGFWNRFFPAEIFFRRIIL